MTALQRAVVNLLEELEQILLEHDEVLDTEVREAIHITLNSYFVWGQERERFPHNFVMFSEQGNLRVADAIRRFLDAAEDSGELLHIPAGQARLDVLQAPSAKTSDGMLYDEFIGHRDTPLPLAPLPEHMFADPDYGDVE